MKKDKSKSEKLSYDIPFQERLLRVLYRDSDFAITLGVPYLDPMAFENNIHRWCADVILNYAKKHMSGATLDAVKIAASQAYISGRLIRKRDKDAVDALIRKLKRPVKDRSFIKEELFRYIKNQTFKQVVNNGLELMKKGRIDKLDVEIQRVLNVKSAETGGLGHFLLADSFKRYKRRKSYKDEGIPSGLETDQYMKGGGPLRKQLAAFIAPPGVGKTNGLINTMCNVVLLGGCRALYITLELAEEIITDRTDARFTGIKIQDLERKKNPRKVRRFMRRLSKTLDGEPIVIKEFPAATITVKHIEHYIRQLERRAFYPDVVFVDYADLLVPEGGKTGDNYEDAGNIYVELRAMAQRLNVLVWTAGQGNRQSLDKKLITMKELADSFQKAMHSDVLLALCQTKEEKKRHHARIFMMKNRNGLSELEFPVRLDHATARVINR